MPVRTLVCTPGTSATIPVTAARHRSRSGGGRGHPATPRPGRAGLAVELHYNASSRRIDGTIIRQREARRMAEDGARDEGVVDFQTDPSRYRHWKLGLD